MASQSVTKRIAESLLADLVHDYADQHADACAEHLVQQAYDVEFKTRGEGGERIVLTFRLDTTDGAESPIQT